MRLPRSEAEAFRALIYVVVVVAGGGSAHGPVWTGKLCVSFTMTDNGWSPAAPALGYHKAAGYETPPYLGR